MTGLQTENSYWSHLFTERIQILEEKLQYFETIFPLVEKQDDVYFRGGGAAGGLWRHQQWSPSSILPEIRSQVKTARNVIFLCFAWKITHSSTLHDFSHNIYFYCWKKLKKHVFSSKIPRVKAANLIFCVNWRKTKIRIIKLNDFFVICILGREVFPLWNKLEV